jgi:hypothetical protein
MAISVYQQGGYGTVGLFPNPVLAPRNPTTSDTVSPSGQPYQVFQGWNNTLTEATFIYLGAGNWVTLSAITGSVNQLTGDSGIATPIAGSIQIKGTAAQISSIGTAGIITLSLIGPYTPATYTAHGVLMGEGATSIVASSAGTSGQVFTSGGAGADGAYQNLGVNSGLTGIVTANGAGAFTANAVTQHGVLIGGASNAAASLAVAATGSVLMGVTGADPAFTGSPSFSGSVTAGLGNIQATNGNLVLNTAGNKIVSTSVGTTTAAGANSFGSVTLVGGTATVATTSVTASSLIFIWRQSVGTTGAAALGMLSVGTITGATSFVINAWQTANATALQTTDVSVVGWMIVN